MIKVEIIRLSLQEFVNLKARWKRKIQEKRLKDYTQRWEDECERMVLQNTRKEFFKMVGIFYCVKVLIGRKMRTEK